VTWADESGVGPDETIESGPPGNVAIVIGGGTEYGATVGQEATVEIRYTPETEDGEEAETVVLATWSPGGDSGGDGDIVDVPEN